MTNILVVTPAYNGQITSEYYLSIINLLSNNPDNDSLSFLVQHDSLITRARNSAFSYFVNHLEFDYMFTIDADIGFKPESFWRLVKSGHDLCAKGYPLKREGAGTTVNVLSGEEVGEDGCIVALDAGTGFMCMSRDCAELLKAEYEDELAYHTDTGTDNTEWAVYNTVIHNGRFLSEDYSLCRRWQLLGGDVMADTEGPGLEHIGKYTFTEQ